MSKKLTETKVLKKLGIKDFSCITLDKIGKFSSMLPQMDPEVAKKALEQFPEFAKAGKEILAEMSTIIIKILDSNDKSVTQKYQACQTILDKLNEELSKENITYEKKMELIEKMIEVVKMLEEYDSENKKFLLKLAIIVGTAGSLILASIGAAIGNQTEGVENHK